MSDNHINNYVPNGILITGGAGFIASHVAIELAILYNDIPIVILDKLDYCSSIHNLDDIINNSNVHFVQGNICSSDLVLHLLRTYAIDTIFHFAAQSHVDNSFGNSIQFTQNNVVGTHVLLESAKNVGTIRRFIHVSTDEVYGEIPSSQSCAKEQETILSPSNPYAATKAAAEFLVRSYNISFNLPTIITRGNNVYGSHQFPEKLIPKFILLLSRDKPVTIHGDGSHKRSFLYVKDVANAMKIIMQKGKIGEIYNIGTDFELSNIDVARQLCAKFGKDESKYITFVEDRPFNDCRYSIDSSKLHNLGWSPKISWNDGLNYVINWYLIHNDHWNSMHIDMCLVAHPRIGL